MTFSAVLLLIGIAVVCGALGQAIAGYSLGGFVISTAIGLVGAVLGLWFADAFNMPVFYVVSVGGVEFPIVWSVLGAAVSVAVVGVLIGGKRW